MRDIKATGKRMPPRAGRPGRFTGESVPLSHISVPPVPAIRPRVTSKPPAAPQTPRFSAPRLGSRERLIVIVLFALAGITALLGALIFLPRADIQLVLRTAPLLVDEVVTFAAQSTDGAAVPATSFFREVPVTGQAETTSTETVGGKARGVVQIINRTFDEQAIKTGSRLVTSEGTLFYMQEPVVVPAASGGGVTSAPVTVEAAEAGAAGNVADGRLDFAALDASSQQLVYAEVRNPLTGGSGEVVKVVAAADIEAAQKAAGEQARIEVEDSIRGELANGWALLDESWTAEALEFKTGVEVGAREAQIPYEGRMRVRVLGFENAALENHLRGALEERLSDQHMLFPGPISYSKTVQNIAWDEGQATVEVRVTHTSIPQFSLDSLREKIAGRKEVEVKSYLEGLPGVRSVELALSPFWVHSVPRIERRIILDLQPERQP